MPHFEEIKLIPRLGLLFLDEVHLKTFQMLTPGRLRDDLEWASAVYILTADDELRKKAACHLNPNSRDINWFDIISTDFGLGHYAAIYWAFGLWGGHSWGGWEDDDGEMIPKIDTISRAYSMDSRLKLIALIAQAYRWGLSEKIFPYDKSTNSHPMCPG